MHPTDAAVASLNWPSKHDAKFEHSAKYLKANNHAFPAMSNPSIYPHDFPKTRFFDLHDSTPPYRSHQIKLRPYSLAATPTLGPLRLCRQNRLRFQLHRFALVRHPYLCILDGDLQLHVAGGESGQGLRASLREIDDREFV